MIIFIVYNNFRAARDPNVKMRRKILLARLQTVGRVRPQGRNPTLGDVGLRYASPTYAAVHRERDTGLIRAAQRRSHMKAWKPKIQVRSVYGETSDDRLVRQVLVEKRSQTLCVDFPADQEAVVVPAANAQQLLGLGGGREQPQAMLERDDLVVDAVDD
jgi:hypothetical protein